MIKHILLGLFLTIHALGDPPPDQQNAPADHSSKTVDASATLSIPSPSTAPSDGSTNAPSAVTGSTVLKIIQQLQKLAGMTTPVESKPPPAQPTDGKQAATQNLSLSEADLKSLTDNVLKEIKKANTDAPNDSETGDQTKKVIDQATKDDFFNDSLSKENRATEERFNNIFKKGTPDF